MPKGLIVEDGAVADIERVAPLWRAMAEHHHAIVDGALPPQRLDETWALRRAQYAEWLAIGDGGLLLAVTERRGEPLGYAFVCVHPPGPTFAIGDRIGELESLAVAEHARGKGVGRALISAARERLRRQGLSYWTVEVIEANDDAVRLYEREGFGSYTRNLIGRLGDA
jgi:ribosomal protein S18 acetylase RimI-like enzyme